MDHLSRRGFLSRSLAILPTLTACGRGIGDPSLATPPADGVEVTAAFVRIDLQRTPSLAVIGSSLVVPAANIMVMHTGINEFRAVSNVCTHAGCGIYEFTNWRLRCQCHGSEFDSLGNNLVGPALLPLTRFVTELTASVLVITRT